MKALLNLLKREKKAIGIIAIATFISNLLAYIPFLSDFNSIGRYWDGPLYMYVAKNFYSASAINPFNIAPYFLPNSYFSAHLFAFPFLIKLCSLFSFGNLYSGMLIAMYVSTAGFLFCFYLYCKKKGWVEYPLTLTLVLLILSPRWIMYHAVGASEPLFLFFIFLSFLLYRYEKYKTAILIASFATVTRIFGILLFPLYIVLFLWEKKYKKLPWTLLIPIPILLNFAYYQIQFNDFFAYFHVDGGLLSSPLRLLIVSSASPTPSYAEYIILMFIIMAFAIVSLYNKNKELFLYGIIFFAPLFLVFHQDLSRYCLPLLPVVALAFNKSLTSKKFLIIIPVILVLEYVYVWNAIPNNLAPDSLFKEVIF